MAIGTCRTCYFWDNDQPLPKWYYEDYGIDPLLDFNGACLLYSQQMYAQEMQRKAPIPKAIAISPDEGTLGTLHTSEDFRCGCRRISHSNGIALNFS